MTGASMPAATRDAPRAELAALEHDARAARARARASATASPMTPPPTTATSGLLLVMVDVHLASPA